VTSGIRERFKAAASADGPACHDHPTLPEAPGPRVRKPPFQPTDAASNVVPLPWCPRRPRPL